MTLPGAVPLTVFRNHRVATRLLLLLLLRFQSIPRIVSSWRDGVTNARYKSKSFLTDYRPPPTRRSFLCRNHFRNDQIAIRSRILSAHTTTIDHRTGRNNAHVRSYPALPSVKSVSFFFFLAASVRALFFFQKTVSKVLFFRQYCRAIAVI